MKYSSRLAMAILTLLAVPAFASAAQDWITTWAASPQPRMADGFFVPNATPLTVTNQTIRQFARVSIGGKQVRVVVSNEYGHLPLQIGAASVARAGSGGAAIVPASSARVTFAGGSAIRIPPGARLVSDAVAFEVKPLETLVVSLFLPEETRIDTIHFDGVQTAYISGPGDFVEAAGFEPMATNAARMLLSGIMVDAAPGAKAVVLFGDSITDGNCSTVNSSSRYPDALAERLQSSGHTGVAVINAGISGARVLKDGMGDNALARLDRDVLAQPHVTTMVMMLGVNDVGWAQMVLDPGSVPTRKDITDIYGMVIDRAHSHGIRVVGATLTPFRGAFEGQPPLDAYYSLAKDTVRKEVNEWIRTSGAFDGVIDFDELLRDPARPEYLLDAYDCGDNLHPNDAGYKAMAESIDLGLLLAGSGGQ